MGRVMGIDFGEKRVGLAISDERGRLAVPYRTLQRRSDRELIAELADIFDQEQISRVALGEPLGLDGRSNAASARVRSFGRKLGRGTGVEVTFVVETLTSAAARERLREAGVDPRRQPERIDSLAAQILLEEALETQSASTNREGER